MLHAFWYTPISSTQRKLTNELTHSVQMFRVALSYDSCWVGLTCDAYRFILGSSVRLFSLSSLLYPAAATLYLDEDPWRPITSPIWFTYYMLQSRNIYQYSVRGRACCLVEPFETLKEIGPSRASNWPLHDRPTLSYFVASAWPYVHSLPWSAHTYKRIIYVYIPGLLYQKAIKTGTIQIYKRSIKMRCAR